MEGRSVGVTLAGFAGVGAIVAALGVSESARPVAGLLQTTAAAPQKGELLHVRVGHADSARASYRRGAELIEAYTRRRVGCVPARMAACTASKPAARDSLQVVIASVPDPFDSHLDWAYDAYVEALRRAMASAGYVPDRFWLPSATDSILVAVARGSTPDTSRLALKDVYPGVLLFRSANPEEHKLMLLYLVGELPTTGEHKEAFLAAVRERRLLLSDATSFSVSKGVRDTLLVAGPIFSGAAQSLRLAIDDAVRFVDPEIRGVRVVSGSATSARNQRVLTDRISRAGIAFHSTLNSDDAMRSVLLSTLVSLGLRDDQVAVLSESSTQYATRDTGSRFLTVTFPINIASLRNEVGDARESAGNSRSLPSLSQTARTRLELRDKSRPRENPPVISALTVPTLELMLGEIMQTLTDHEIRAVVIQATDVRDQLMLAREIRQRNRDAQVILFQGHRLLLRPEYASQLNGTLVLTSYPLFLENQWWSRTSGNASPRELLSLSSDAAIGTYNSVLTLLSLRANRIEYDSPTRRTCEPALPPVWLTAVAHGAFMPILATPATARLVAYLDTTEARKRAARATLDAAHGQHTGATLGAGVLAMLLVSACLVVLITRRGLGPLGANTVVRHAISYRRIEGYALVIHERIYATLLVIALVGVFVPLAATLLLMQPGLLARTAVWTITSLALVTIATGVADVLRLVWRTAPEGLRYARDDAEWRDGSSRETTDTRVMSELFRSGRLAQLRWIGEVTGRGLIALIGLGHLSLTLLYAVQLRDLALVDRPRFLLFAFRALKGWSGISPLPPLLLCGAGFALWSAWQWRLTHRLYAATTATEEVALRHARSRHGRTLNDSFTRTALFVDRARASLFRIHPTGGGFFLTLLLLVLATQMHAQHVGSIERLVMVDAAWQWSFDALFGLGTFAMLVTGAWALYRIMATWQALHGALGALGETPIINAFGRLPRHIAKLTRLNIFADSDKAATLNTANARWRELCRQLRELEHEFGSRPAAAVSDTDRGAHEALVSIIRRPVADCSFSTLDKRVRMRHVRRTLCALRAAWQSTNTTPAADGVVPHETRGATATISGAMRTAEEFIAIESVRCIESILHDVRLLASFLLVTLLLSVALLSSYPFQPQGLIKLAFIALLVGTVVVLFVVMTQMSRDDVLSAITRTDPGKVSWDTTLVLNIALFGAIPLLALLSSEFPAVRTLLFSWAEPMVRSLVKG